MISLLVPTRGRPARFKAMLASARATASESFEICAWLDEDDPTRDQYPEDPQVRYGSGPRPYVDGVLCTSGLWTEAWALATGDIAMLASDDIVFRTRGWDQRIEAAFASVSDRIVMVYPNDGTRRQAPVNLVVSREWIEVAGFTPADFQGWFGDDWIWSIAAKLRRVVFLSDVRVSHAQRRGSDDTYRDGENARAAVGGLEGMRSRFYSPEMTARRDEQTERLRALMMDGQELVPSPVPSWFTESLKGSRMGRGELSGREDTLVVVHCYQGDAELVRAFLPQFLHHGCKVLVLSPADSPVQIDHPGVECRSAGNAAYFGQDSLDRQRAHLELLLTYPQTYFLLNDADSMCLSPEIPAYLYEGAQGTVWSNEVRETRPHPSPYPKIAFHPPYFLHRDTISRMLEVADRITAHPITPFIDWYMVALACEAGLDHKSYPDGRSGTAWKHGPIPETKEMGHNFVHTPSTHGVDGAQRMRQFVARGTVMVHSIKHPPVRDLLVVAHAKYVAQNAHRAERAARIAARTPRQPPPASPVPRGEVPSISALVAFRDDSPGQERARLWALVRGKLEREFPEIEIVQASDDGQDPFHKTLALNRAAAQASEAVFYILDSDSWVLPEAVRDGAALIGAGAAWCKPWKLKLKLGPEATENILARGDDWNGTLTSDHRRALENRNTYQPAPPLLVARHAFEAVGGMDERYRGWGGEDLALWTALKALYGVPPILQGECIHLHHPRLGRSGFDRWPGQEDSQTNAALHREYRRAARSEATMRAFLAERVLTPTR